MDGHLGHGIALAGFGALICFHIGVLLGYVLALWTLMPTRLLDLGAPRCKRGQEVFDGTAMWQRACTEANYERMQGLFGGA